MNFLHNCGIQHVSRRNAWFQSGGIQGGCSQGVVVVCAVELIRGFEPGTWRVHKGVVEEGVTGERLGMESRNRGVTETVSEEKRRELL